MSIWIVAEIMLLVATIPCAYAILRGSTVGDSLLGLQMGGTIAVLAFVVISQAILRPSSHDVAIVLALLSFASGFILAYFLERWFR